MEDQFLQLAGHPPDLNGIVCRFDPLQQIPNRIIRGAHASRIAGTHAGSLDELMAGGFLGFRPSRPNGFPGAFAPLFRSEFSGSGGATLLPALASQSNGGWILLPGCHKHIVRDRSRIREVRERSRMTLVSARGKMGTGTKFRKGGEIRASPHSATHRRPRTTSRTLTLSASRAAVSSRISCGVRCATGSAPLGFLTDRSKVDGSMEAASTVHDFGESARVFYSLTKSARSSSLSGLVLPTLRPASSW